LHEREQVFSFLKRIKLIPKSEHKEMIKLVLDNFGAEQFIASLSDFYEDSFNAALAESNERLAGVYASKRYKLGNILLYLPSKIKSAIWCLRHRGLRYTVSLALEKLRKAYRAAVSFLKGQEEIPIEEEKKIKFSIVITNRNNESSLERTICSALEQDYADIELICVDDASTDRSREIIGSFENRENFIAVYNEEDSGSSCSRLSGIERAGGDYLLFLDSDGMLMPNCCSALAKVLKRKACDILGFGTEPEYTVVKSQSERARLEKHFSPKRARLDSKGYRRAFYEKKQIKHDVRSKCYSIELARKAASKMQKDHINLCDDFYFSFIAALYVNSYCGTSKKLIRHRFGMGIPSADAYTKTELVQDLNSVLNVFRLCREFACEQTLEETYFRYISLYEREQIFGFLERIKLLPESEREDMVKLILEQFGAEQFIVSLSDFCESSLKRLTNLANPGELFPYTRRAAKTVGLYCRCLCGDGPGKALCRTADYLIEAGYRVIIISDKDGSPPYCPLAEDVKRICLDLENCEPGNYLIRYRKLRDCIVNKHIDIFINYDFSSDFGGLDLCTVKSTDCAYMLYCHSPHVAGLIDGSSNILDKQAVYTYADAVVTLSSVDRIFWSRVNQRTFQITVPLSPVWSTPPLPRDGCMSFSGSVKLMTRARIPKTPWKFSTSCCSAWAMSPCVSAAIWMRAAKKSCAGMQSSSI
jgi:glycosyltransferase involved in cell wall biosynthesis